MAQIKEITLLTFAGHGSINRGKATRRDARIHWKRRQMSSKSVHYLNNDARPKNDPPRSRGLEHLAAAHEKLMRLQTIRRKLKEDYGERVAELDVAMREIEENKCVISKQSDFLGEQDSVIQAQSRLIDDLRAEMIELKSRLTRRSGSAAPGSDTASIVMRAVDRHDQQNSRLIDKSSNERPSLSTRVYRRLKSL